MTRIQQMGGNGGASSSPGIPQGQRVYAIGDLHGRFDLLMRLHRLIAADLTIATPRTAFLVYLGDYVDRGPQSFEVIDSFVNAPLAGVQPVHLKGNHEDMLLDFLGECRMADTWLMNGGIETLASYGVDLPLFETDPSRIEAARREFRQALPESHLAFLRGLELYREIGGYLFVHAGLRPGVALEDQDPRDLMWMRDEVSDDAEPRGPVVVHGHTISPEPRVRAGRIGIDTGAYRSGRLTCLVLEGTDRRFLST